MVWCFCLLVLGLHSVWCEYTPLSPCPDIFHYGIHGSTVYGVVRLRPIEPVLSLALRTKFTVGAPLFSKYQGLIEAEDSKQLLENYNRGVPAVYYVHFPVRSPVPRLIELSVNGQNLCIGQPESRHAGQYVTTLRLQHTSSGHSNEGVVPLRRPGTDTDAEFRNPTPVINSTEPTPNVYLTSRTDQTQPQDQVYRQQPPTRKTPDTVYETTRATQKGNKTSYNLDSIAYRCGQVRDGKNQELLFKKGEPFVRGELPWLVPIYRLNDVALIFICGGTLVSDQHVVTAAHCKQRGSDVGSTKDILLRLGAHDLRIWNEEDVVIRTVISAVIHENYDPSNRENDLLLLRLNKRVAFTRYIRPVCLWSREPDLNNVVGQMGIMAGWGDQGKPYSVDRGVPHMVSLKIISQAQCKSSETGFHYITNSKTLCTSTSKGVGPCKGDFGGGLYLLDGNVWRLRAVVSQVLTPDDFCTLNEYVVYTDIAQYQEWLKQQILSDLE